MHSTWAHETHTYAYRSSYHKHWNDGFPMFLVFTSMEIAHRSAFQHYSILNGGRIQREREGTHARKAFHISSSIFGPCGCFGCVNAASEIVRQSSSSSTSPPLGNEKTDCDRHIKSFKSVTIVNGQSAWDSSLTRRVQCMCWYVHWKLRKKQKPLICICHRSPHSANALDVRISHINFHTWRLFAHLILRST